ncbi:hypothetical protein [Paraburkholderia tropica]|uniref:hypothetical protein n=1 Tax=Paraburkholderia tropica TaxID=92647 RepID=UPI003D273565
METGLNFYNPHAPIAAILFLVALVLVCAIAELKITKEFEKKNFLKATSTHLIVVGLISWWMMALYETDFVLALTYASLIAGSHLWFRCIGHLMEN